MNDTAPTALQSTADGTAASPKKKSRSRSRSKAKPAAVALALPMHACPTPVVSCSNRFSPLQSFVTFPKWLKKVAARHELIPKRETTRKEQPIKAALPLEEEYIRLETVLAQARAYKLHREVYPHSRLTKAQFFVEAKPAAVLGQPTPFAIPVAKSILSPV